MLLKRTKKTPLTHAGFAPPPPHGFTDKRGVRTWDAPKEWPFGTVAPVKSKAQPRVKRKIQEDEDE